jgi:opacity protein-like surface antigen
MRSDGTLRQAWQLGVAAVVAVAAPTAAALAQQEGGVPVRSDRNTAKEARSGIGLWVGDWRVRDNGEAPSSVRESETPMFEGLFATGLDLHLTLENSVSFWRRAQTVTLSGGTGGPATQSVTGYIVPQFTSLRAYPFTRPTARVEPYLRAGAGFAIGIEDHSGATTGPLGTSAGGTSFVPGFGLTGGAGLEVHATRALGLGVGARYLYVQFFNEGVAGTRFYRGVTLEGGLTYRFQYE